MNKKNNISEKAANQSATPKVTLLQTIEHIVEKARGSKLSDKFMTQNNEDIQRLAQAYNITPEQAVLFSVCLELGPYNVNYNDLAQYFGVSGVRVLTYGESIDALVRRHLLNYRNYRSEDSFNIPDAVVKCLRHNEVYEVPVLKDLDCQDIIDTLDDWFDDVSDGTLSPEMLTENVMTLFRDNRQVEFVHQVMDMHLDESDVVLLAKFCCLLVVDDDNHIYLSQVEDLYTRRNMFNILRANMRNGEHILMVRGLIEHVCEDGVVNTSCFCLTDKAKRTLLAELKIRSNEVKYAEVLYPDKITPKRMFYPDGTDKQIHELNGFFDNEQFVKIQQRMQESGFRYGFACLFYGAPGTGKTETVYQLARMTGRGIMLVDVPQIKSKWVGDSEKNIKALFDRYRDLVKVSPLAPILLFNEADAIISVRKNGAENAVDKMENTIQNIILQEMENLNGIMIATTNLVGNLDTAFERRFLYKVKFEKPDASVRSRIWQQMVPDLDDQDAQTLAKAFDLSGGQIENVARKDTINHILHGDCGNRLTTLMDFCKAEAMETSTTHRRIGY